MSSLPIYKDCFLYLGHNASVLLYNSIKDFLVFEEEKLIRQKGGEYVPLNILLRLRHYRIRRFYIINFLGPIDYKSFLLSYFHGKLNRIKSFLKKSRLFEIHLNHHLKHAYHGLIFFLNHSDIRSAENEIYHFIVNDGSGNDFESFTLYEAPIRQDDDFESIIKNLKIRAQEQAGYFSCGHLYARALCNKDTGFTLLKDEYKSLGYESDIPRLFDRQQLVKINRIIKLVAEAYLYRRPNFVKESLINDIRQYLPNAPQESRVGRRPEKDFFNSLKEINFDATEWDRKLEFIPFIYVRHNRSVFIKKFPDQHFTHQFSVKKFQEIVKNNIPLPTIIGKWTEHLPRNSIRVVCSYLANRFLIEYYRLIIERYKVKNLIASGGVHYNVKLNHFIMRQIPGKFSVTPVCGDVGHALTCAAIKNKDFREKVKDLNILSRKLDKPRVSCEGNYITYTTHTEEFIEKVSGLVAEKGVVNILKGKGELGPRALLNTSTLSLPGAEYRRLINKINGRDDYMPMAPVLLEENLDEFFYRSEYERVIGSLHYMIVALTYKSQVDRNIYGGVMHYDPLAQVFTGRPQVVSKKDRLNTLLLKSIQKKTGVKAFINTSFNRHGKATVLTYQQAVDDFQYQLNRSGPNKKPHLVILSN